MRRCVTSRRRCCCCRAAEQASSADEHKHYMAARRRPWRACVTTAGFCRRRCRHEMCVIAADLSLTCLSASVGLLPETFAALRSCYIRSLKTVTFLIYFTWMHQTGIIGIQWTTEREQWVSTGAFNLGLHSAWRLVFEWYVEHGVLSLFINKAMTYLLTYLSMSMCSPHGNCTISFDIHWICKLSPVNLESISLKNGKHR